MIRSWRAWLVGVAALAVLAAPFVATTRLSAALLLAPLIAIAAIPVWLVCGRRWWWLAPLIAAGFMLPWWQGLRLERFYDAHPVWWDLALRGWCASGALAVAVGVAARCAAAIPALPVAGRWLAGGIIAAAGLATALPITNLYVPHLTADDAPRVAAAATGRDLVIAGADGVSLDARLYLPRNPAQPVGLVVFSHGYGGWKEGFLNHLKLFTAAGWAVLAYDLRGHGRSSPAVVTYGAREAEDLVQVWTVASGLAEGRPMVAYGVSLGAGITLLAGHRLPGCRAVIAESPLADLGAMMRDSLSPPFAAAARVIARLGTGLNPDDIRPVAAPVLAGVMPLMIGWIATDTVIPAAQSAAVAAAAPRATTMIMAAGRHLDLITYLPWRRAVIAFLARFAPGPNSDGSI